MALSRPVVAAVAAFDEPQGTVGISAEPFDPISARISAPMPSATPAPTIWLTGLSGAGKSTLANGLKRELDALKIASVILDGDILRTGLTSDLGFTDEDREENVRRVSEVAALFNAAGLVAIVALISPRKRHRAMAREVTSGRFREVYVNGSIEACQRRDVKGLYARALAGNIPRFTGLSAPYEAPDQADLVLSTDISAVEDCLEQLLRETLDAIQGTRGARLENSSQNCFVTPA